MGTYRGSCHCGAVRFSVQADLARLTRCTCSMCSKKGVLACYVPPERFQLLEGGDDLALYQFNKKLAKHFFCKHCGIHAFGHPRSNFDLEAGNYTVELFDGRHWEAAYKARLEARDS